VDFLEAMLQWHSGNSTGVDLVLREVQDAIVAEVTSFPVDKVARRESPSVAMHVPVPLLRASPNGEPSGVAEMAAAAVDARKKRPGVGGDAASSATQASTQTPGVGKEVTAADNERELFASFPTWRGWTQPSVALTLRAVLMTASALTAAAGMQQPMIEGGGDAKEELSRRRRRAPQILLPDALVHGGDGDGDGAVSEVGDVRAAFNALWPNAPYSFGTYGRDSVSSDESYYKGFGGGGEEKKKRNEKRLVIIVNVSAPGDEKAAESDGEGMVNAAETLLELGIPFVVLTLWQDNALARSVVAGGRAGRDAKEEKNQLRVLMEKRTRILLGRSVKRKEARDAVREAYSRAKKAPQGRGFVELEEALAEARAVGADAGEGEVMLEEIRAQAREAEESALAAALTAACLQVPVDVPGLKANLQRAKVVLQRYDAAVSAAAVSAAAAAAAAPTPLTEKEAAEAAEAWNESAARADVLLSHDEESESDAAEEDGDGASTDRGATRGGVPLRDFVAGDSGDSSLDDEDAATTATKKRPKSALRAAVAAAEAALEALTLEADLRVALADEASLNVASVPTLEALMVRAAKVAERKPPLTDEGAAKLNTLVSRCFSRATALQEMDLARATLSEALEPELRGRALRPGTLEREAVANLESAISRAKTAAWPWQLEDAVNDAEAVLARWRALEKVELAMKARNAAKLRVSIDETSAAHPAIELREALKLCEELEAERALEGGDQRLKAYFAANKVAWASGSPTEEAEAMLATIRQSLDITDAEHEQVTRAATAGRRTPAEEAKVRSIQKNLTHRSLGFNI